MVHQNLETSAANTIPSNSSQSQNSSPQNQSILISADIQNRNNSNIAIEESFDILQAQAQLLLPGGGPGVYEDIRMKCATDAFDSIIGSMKEGFLKKVRSLMVAPITFRDQEGDIINLNPTEVFELFNENTQRKTDNTKMAQMVVDAQKRGVDLESENNKLLDSKKEIEKQLKSAQDQIESFKSERVKSEKDHKKKEEEWISCEKTFQTRISSLESDKKTLSSDKAILEKDLETAKKEVQNLVSKLKKKKTDMDKMEAHGRKRIEAIKTKAEGMISEAVQAEKTRFESQEKEWAEYKKKMVQNIEEERSLNEMERKRVQEERQKSIKIESESQEKNDKLNREISDLRSKLEKSERAVMLFSTDSPKRKKRKIPMATSTPNGAGSGSNGGAPGANLSSNGGTCNLSDAETI